MDRPDAVPDADRLRAAGVDPDRDPRREPRLERALRAMAPADPGEPDWRRLGASIRERAELPLARRRREHTVAWKTRPLLPAAVAAGLALAVALRAIVPGPGEDGNGANGALGFQPVVEEVLGAPITEAEVDLLFGPADADLLVVAAFGEP